MPGWGRDKLEVTKLLDWSHWMQFQWCVLFYIRLILFSYKQKYTDQEFSFTQNLQVLLSIINFSCFSLKKTQNIWVILHFHIFLLNIRLVWAIFWRKDIEMNIKCSSYIYSLKKNIWVYIFCYDKYFWAFGSQNNTHLKNWKNLVSFWAKPTINYTGSETVLELNLWN